jgi:hypothetical protein
MGVDVDIGTGIYFDTGTDIGIPTKNRLSIGTIILLDIDDKQSPTIFNCSIF